MGIAKIVGIILLVVGAVGLAVGGFSFTKETTQAQIGPIKLQVKEQESVNIPQWLSIGALVIGGLLLVVGFKRK